MTQAVAPRKEQINRVAARLFRAQGFHGTSVRDIAEGVGIQGGSLYAHVDSKDDMLWDIVNASANRFFSALGPIVESDGEIVRKIREAIIAHVGVITDDLDAAAVYTTEWRHLTGDRREAFARRRDEYETLFRTLVDQGIREGFLAAVDEACGTLFVLSALNYVYIWYRPEGRLSPADVAVMMANFIFDGLRRRTT